MTAPLGFAGRVGQAHVHFKKEGAMDRDAIEEKLAHLIRASDDLSDVVAAQSRRIDRLERQVALLTERERSREGDGGGGVVIGDERPPHW